MCKFPLTGCLQINCKNFFAKLVQSVSLFHRLSKKLKVRLNPSCTTVISSWSLITMVKLLMLHVFKKSEHGLNIVSILYDPCLWTMKFCSFKDCFSTSHCENVILYFVKEQWLNLVLNGKQVLRASYAIGILKISA